MTTPIDLSMEFCVGLSVDGIEEAGPPVEELLGVQLVLEDDLELGGAYLEYEPRPPPEAGVVGVRVQVNNVEGIGWVCPDRRDLPYLAFIQLGGTDLLDLGRLATTFVERGMSLASYNIGPAYPGAGGRELWCAHYARFASDEAARERWMLDAAGGSGGITLDGGRAAPVLLCYLCFGVDAPDLATARAATEAAFRVDLSPGYGNEMGGAFLEHARADAGIDAVSSLIVRKNQIDRWTKVSPEHENFTFLLEVTLHTQSLLDLGRMARTIEREGLFHVLAYRVMGDLVRDRVPRVLMRELTRLEVASGVRAGSAPSIDGENTISFRPTTRPRVKSGAAEPGLGLSLTVEAS